MPRLLAAISFIGTLAMLWVGGHIFLVSLYEIGGHDGLLEGTAIGDALHAPYDLLHHWEVDVHDAVGGALGGIARVAAQHRACPRWSALSSAWIVLAVCVPSGWVGAQPRRRATRDEHPVEPPSSTRRAYRPRAGESASGPPRIPRNAEDRPTLFWSAREIPTMHRCAAQTHLLDSRRHLMDFNVADLTLAAYGRKEIDSPSTRCPA